MLSERKPTCRADGIQMRSDTFSCYSYGHGAIICVYNTHTFMYVVFNLHKPLEEAIFHPCYKFKEVTLSKIRQEMEFLLMVIICPPSTTSCTFIRRLNYHA